MAKLPDATALGERPAPQLPRRTPMVSTMRSQTGFEDEPARALSYSGMELQRTADTLLKAKEEADTLAAEDAYNKLKQKQIEITYGPNGLLNQRGADAVNRDLPAIYGKQLVSASQELSGGLTNDYQKQLFARRAAQSQLELQHTAFQHVANESNVYANQVLQGTLDTESRVAAAGGPADISLVRINAAIDRHAQRFGLPEQAVTDLKMKAADSIWTSKVKGLLATDPIRAQAVFKEHENEFGPESKPVLEHQIKTAVLPLQAKSVADFVLSGRNQQAIPELMKTLTIGGEDAIVKVSQQIDKEQGPAPTKVSDTRAALGNWIAASEKYSEALHPGDPVFRDMVVQQVKGYVNTVIAMQEGVQRQAQGVLLTAATGGPDGKQPKPMTLDALLSRPGAREAYSLLDAQAAFGIRQHLEANQREAIGVATKSNVPLYFSLVKRMYSDGEDRITSATQLLPFMRADGSGLSPGDFERLKGDLAYSQTPEGRAFGVDRNKIVNLATNMLVRSPVGSVYQDQALDGAKRFADDLDKKIAEYRKAGKDPRDLFDSSKPDYVASPSRVATFMPNARQAIADKAAAAYEAGKVYEFKQGKMKFKGGDPKNQANWESVK